MRLTLTRTLELALLTAAIVLSMRQSSAEGVQAPATTTQSSASGTQAHTLTLPTIDTVLPDAPGRATVQATCGICHSNRYITMQPRFSRKAWDDEVQKMVRNYGAPVPQQQVQEIVNYLYAIRGIDQGG